MVNTEKYKLFNQDCMEVFKTITDNSIDLIVTDPPYRVISGGKPHKEKGAPSGMLSKNDGKIFDYNDIEPEDWVPEIYRVLKSGGQAYIMVNVLNMERYLRICRETGFGLHNILVWKKNNVTCNKWYMKNCEFTLFLRKGKAKFINECGSKQVSDFDNIIGNKLHPTQKPVELMEMYIRNSSDIGDTVLDPFMGVGTTGIAAMNLDRKFVGIEIDKKYFDIASELIGEKYYEKSNNRRNKNNE